MYLIQAAPHRPGGIWSRHIITFIKGHMCFLIVSFFAASKQDMCLSLYTTEQSNISSVITTVQFLWLNIILGGFRFQESFPDPIQLFFLKITKEKERKGDSWLVRKHSHLKPDSEDTNAPWAHTHSFLGTAVGVTLTTCLLMQMMDITCYDETCTIFLFTWSSSRLRQVGLQTLRWCVEAEESQEQPPAGRKEAEENLGSG